MLPTPAVLGINLWLITLVVPLLVSRVPPAPLLAATLPLCPLALALGLRWSRRRSPLAHPVLVLVVPLLAFLPMTEAPTVALSAGSGQALFPRPTLLLLAAVLLAYLISACRHLALGAAQAGPDPDPTQPSPTPLPAQPVPRHWRRRLALYRFLIGLSAALPALLLYAIHLHPPTLRALHLSFGPRAPGVQAATAAAAALLWVFCFYTCFFLPMRSHLDHDREALAEVAALRRLARRGRPRVHFYVAMVLALGSMILLIWRSLRP
jgi:hypothetical protein